MWPRPSSGAGGLGTDGPGPGAAICGAPKLITRPGQWPFRCEYGTPPAMKRLLILLIVGISLISTVPLYAQRQQQNVAKLKADARNLVGIIGSDKTKTQTYCQIEDLSEQLIQAVQEKDRKKANALAEKIAELYKKMGPEVAALTKLEKHVVLNSLHG